MNSQTDYYRFRVKTDDGRSTTVSVKPALMAQAIGVTGDWKRTRRLVTEVAKTFVPTHQGQLGRSAVVNQMLRNIVEAAEAVHAGGKELDAVAIDALLSEQQTKALQSGATPVEAAHVEAPQAAVA